MNNNTENIDFGEIPFRKELENSVSCTWQSSPVTENSGHISVAKSLGQIIKQKDISALSTLKVVFLKNAIQEKQFTPEIQQLTEAQTQKL